MTIDIQKSPTLIALQEQRTLTKTKLEDAAAALTRAEANVATWTERQAEAMREAEAQEAAECERLSAWIADGENVGEMSAMPDDVIAERLNGVKLNLSVAQRAGEALRAAHEATRVELAAIEKAIAAEADRLLNLHREALAEKVEEAYAAFTTAVETLRALTPDGLHSAAPPAAASPRVAAALARLSQMEDGIHAPLNQLRGSLFNSAARLNSLRSALIAGEGVSN